MSKFITTQRWGTISQWQNSTIIPKKGELVIAEGTHTVLDSGGENGQTKAQKYFILKIGNGVDYWSALPEVDAATEAKIDLTRDSLQGQINALVKLMKDEGQMNDFETELVNIRGAYDTAGEAVRAIESEVEDLKAGVADFMNADAAGGLSYEENMLQLVSTSGVPIGDPVEIKGGSGGGGGSSTTVRVTNLNGSSSLSAAKDAPVILKFKFTSVEDGIPTGDGTCSIAVDNQVKVTYNIKQGENEIDVSPYLNVGTNTVKLTCTDMYGGYRSLVYTVTVVELSISSTFDATVAYTGDIPFKYIPVGVISKTTHFVIDGEEIATATTTSTNKQMLQTLPAMSHGVHRLDVYITALVGDVEAESNHLLYDVICVEDMHTEAMIASVYTATEIEQGDQIAIPYIVYDPSTLTAKVDRKITYLKSGELTTYREDQVEVDRSQQTWSTRSYPAGQVTFTLSYDYNWSDTLGKYLGHVEVSHTIQVSEPQIDVQPTTTGLTFCLSSKDRSNNELDPAIWEDRGVTTTFQNLNWKSNGWIADSNGDTCLRLNGDARAVINYNLFGKDFKTSGKTIEFEFVVRDVNNRDAVVIDCLSGGIGLQVTADTATFNSQNTQVKCNFKDEVKTRVSFVIEESSNLTNRLVYVYLDGILSGVQQYPTTDNFEQLTPIAITLGTSLCGVDLYTIRVYDMALTANQMVNNYIADMPNMSEKLAKYTANDIYDEFSRLSYERIKSRIPVVTLIGDLPKYKGDKKTNSVTLKFEDPFHPELNFTDLCSSFDVQGTSSQFYVRKNWKVKFKTAHQHMPGELPAKVFCLKVDYAESTGTHNTQAANFIEKLYSEKIPPQLKDSRHRSTVEGFPIAIFEQATEDSEPVFASKANFNYDKGASNVYGLTTDYDTESWEFCNNTSAPCNFTGVIDSSAKWVDDFEPRYAPPFTCADGTVLDEPFDTLDELEEKAADVNNTLTPEEEARMQELRKGLIARFKEVHDWVVSTKDNKDKFRREFEDHFNLHFSLIYYVFTFFALMVDQRAKNLFLTYWNPDGVDGGGRWYPYFYDNDTIFGINNEGALTFDYYHEDIDKLGDAYVYNGQMSTLWVNFRECFSSEIQAMYKTLRENGKLTYDKLINQFVTQGSDMWCENIYNEDADYKYISIIDQPDSTGKLWSTSQLYQVRGSGKQHLDYFVKNRINYCDSKWQVGDYASNMINVRIYTPVLEEGQVLPVPANPNITITPYSNMYAGVRYKLNGTLLKQRLEKNTPYTFEPPLQADGTQETFNDTETVVYGADQISSLGDLSGLYCGSLDVSAATKLVELIVGNHTKGYKNDNFRSISLGTNRLLRKLDLTNCSGLGVVGEPQKTLSLIGCPNIEEVEAFGTNLSTIELPESGYVRVLHLPGSINNLTIKNQLYVEDLQVEDYTNITTLCIDNCPTINSAEVLEKCSRDGKYTVERVRLTGLNWSFEDVSFLKTLFNLKGVDSNDNNTDYAYLVGTCHIASLTGAEMKEVNDHFPYLEITFDSLESQLTFVDSYGRELNRQTIYNGGDGIEPVENRLISAPTKSSSAQWTYTWSGWSRRNGELEEPQEDAVLNVLADRTLYPTFTRELRSYDVRFWWNSGDAAPKYVAKVPYGSDATYPEDVYGTPIKATSSADAFEFAGWSPAPEKITGPLDCYAQYTVKEGEWHECLLTEFDYNTNTEDQTIALTRWKGTATVIDIPEEFETDRSYSTTSIGGFSSSDVVLVDLPDTLQTIENSAFLSAVELEAITIPENVTSIGRLAFSQCTALKSIEYNAKDCRVADGASIQEKPFEGAGADEGMVITIGPEVTKIPEGMFYQYKSRSGSSTYATIEELKFEGDKCIAIENDAFKGCNIKNFEIPSSVKTIGDYAFWINKFKEHLEIPEGVISIGRNCFQEWSALRSIKLPSTLTTIGDGAFRESPRIEYIEIAKNNNFAVINQCLIRNRDQCLIFGCANSILPESVKSFAEGAFEGCEGLQSVVIPEGVTQISQAVFRNCVALSDVTLPSNLKVVWYSAFYNCAMPHINLPEGLESILSYAFAYGQLEEIKIPDSCTAIESSAFRGNTRLTTADLGTGVKSLGTQVFANCLAMTTITLSDSLQVIEGPETLFQGCTSLTTVNCPFAEGAVAGLTKAIPAGVTVNYNYQRIEEE